MSAEFGKFLGPLSQQLGPLWQRLELGRAGPQKTKEYVAPEVKTEEPLGDQSITDRPRRRRIAILEGDAGTVSRPAVSGA